MEGLSVSKIFYSVVTLFSMIDGVVVVACLAGACMSIIDNKDDTNLKKLTIILISSVLAYLFASPVVEYFGFEGFKALAGYGIALLLYKTSMKMIKLVDQWTWGDRL